MQEAYRPRYINYSTRPGPTGWGGGVYPRWSTPLAGVPPGQVRWGVPSHRGTPTASYPTLGAPPAGVPLQLDLAGVPSHLDLAGVPPQVWTDRMMDRHVSKHYLPVILRTRSVISKGQQRAKI